MSPESQAARDVIGENAVAHETFERETAERLNGDTNRQKTAAEELSGKPARKTAQSSKAKRR